MFNKMKKNAYLRKRVNELEEKLYSMKQEHDFRVNVLKKDLELQKELVEVAETSDKKFFTEIRLNIFNTLANTLGSSLTTDSLDEFNKWVMKD